MSVSRRSARSEALLVIGVVLAVAGYILPWAVATSSALTFSAYDLAEWTSLIPGIRYGAEPMAVPGQLRAVLIVIALCVALLPARRNTRTGLAAAGVAVALVIAQLPPLEYFLGEGFRADVNYGQQFTFSLLSLIGVVLCWMIPRGAPRKFALVVTGGLGALVAVLAAARSQEALAGLDVAFSVGIGPWLTAAGAVAVAVVALQSARRRESQGAP